MIVKNYAKNEKQVQQQQKLKLPNCPSCKRNNWLEFDKGYNCQNWEYIINKQKRQIDKKKFLDKITIFLPDYHMLIKRKEKFG